MGTYKGIYKVNYQEQGGEMFTPVGSWVDKSKTVSYTFEAKDDLQAIEFAQHHRRTVANRVGLHDGWGDLESLTFIRSIQIPGKAPLESDQLGYKEISGETFV